MPTYSISAPNGQTYQIDGPAGATQAQVQAEVMRQHPDAGTPVAPPKATGQGAGQTAANATGQAQQPSGLDQALGVLKNVAGGALEPIATVATGAVAKPLGDLAGLAGNAANAAGLTDSTGADWQKNVQNMFTYRPQTAAGQSNVAAIGKAADATLGSTARFAGNYYATAAQKAGLPDDVVEAVRRGATEATQQAPALVGSLAATRAAAAPAEEAASALNPSQVLQTARQRGLMVTPTQAASQGGGATGTIDKAAAAAASMSGSEVKLAQAISRYNSGTKAPQIAAQDIGQTELTPQTLDAAATKAQAPYNAIRALGAGGPGTAPVLLGDDATLGALKAKLDKIGVRDAAVDSRYGSPNSQDIADLQQRLAPKQNPAYSGPQTDAINGANEPAGQPGMPTPQLTPARLTSNLPPRASVGPSQADLFQLRNPGLPPAFEQADAIGSVPGRAPAQGATGQQMDMLGNARGDVPAQFQPENPAAVLGIVQRLRDEARNLYKAQGDNTKLALADATKKAADAMDDFLQTSLSKAGYKQLADSYVQGRTQLAKINSIQDAYNAPAGTLDVSSLARDLDNGVPLSGGLKDLAESYKAFPKAFQKAENMPQTANTSVLETGALLAAVKTWQLKTAALIASRPLSRAYAQTQGFQNRMVYGPGAAQSPASGGAGIVASQAPQPQQAPQ